MMNKKVLLTIFLSAVIIADLCSITVSADWRTDDITENKYYYIDGEQCQNGLFFIEGVMYKFDKDGVCLGTYSGWTRLKSDKKKYKYYYNDGTPANEWCFINGKYYYFDNLIYTGENYSSIRTITNPVVNKNKEQFTISFILENPTDRYVSHGHLFELEQLINGKWQRLKLNDDFGYRDETANEPPQSKKKINIDVLSQYGNLESGTYRIVYGKTNMDYSDSFTIWL